MILTITTLPSATSAGCRGGGLLAASPVPRANPGGGSAARWSRRAPRTRSRRSRGRRSSRRSARPARCAGKKAMSRGTAVNASPALWMRSASSATLPLATKMIAWSTAVSPSTPRLMATARTPHCGRSSDRRARGCAHGRAPCHKSSRNRHEAVTAAFREGGYGSPVPTAIATPWGKATLVDEVRVQQRAGDKRFSSLVQLLEVKDGERLVRFAYATNGAARRGPVTLRARDLEKLRAALRERPELREVLLL